MSLNIKSEEAEHLARQLAAATGESLTRAVTVAVRERLERVQHRDQADIAERASRLRKIAKDAAGRWAEPYRGEEHGDLLYDDRGVAPLIVDTSAVVAILRDEPDADRYTEALARASGPLISAGTYLESAIVIDLNRDPVLSGRLDDLLAVVGAKIEPVTKRHAEIARQAYRDFGKGSGHPAGLNFGDCFAYALARATGEPLLFKGDDFAKTDVEAVLASSAITVREALHQK